MTTSLPRITGLLVTHNGARWLPRVMAALTESTSVPEAWVVVDTGSEDDSARIAAAGLEAVAREVHTITLPVDTSYGAAVAAGLAALPAVRGAGADDWIWLLHDDTAPAPHCFERLVEIISEGEEQLAAVGPKQREWPSLKRLLEVGVTVTGTGRRETGLEPGEYDQGQHDEYTAVLAVNTSAMLVRRDVLEQIGFAEELPLFGNDLDFGWRVASAGYIIRIVPTAVVFHAEAAHRGQRKAALAARPHRDERVAAMFTVLANGSARAHPVRLVRLFVGGLLRALGYLLVRAAHEARAELAAIGFVYGHIGQMRRARKARRSAAVVPDSAVAPLLAPFWLPWRHGLDFVVDVARAAYHVGRDSFERRRRDSPDQGPVVVRLLRSPLLWAVIIAFVAGRDQLTGPPLSGGALLPAPSGVGHWWGLWAQPWHWAGQGSAASGPPAVFVLAIAGTVLAGKPAVVVWLMFLMTVPLCYLGAVRFYRRLCPSLRISSWAAATYAVLPVVTGAVGQGRVGTVGVAIALPWAGAAAFSMADASLDRRRRGLWRTILGLGVVVAFAPALIALVAVVAILLPALGARRISRPDRVLLVIVPAVLSLTWLPTFAKRPGSVLFETGRADFATPTPDVWHLLSGSSGGPGAAPWWLLLPLSAVAVLALIRAQTRGAVARVWIVAGCAAVGAAVLTRTSVALPGVVDPVRPWPGAFFVVMSAALISAVALAADGLAGAFSGVSFGWRQPVAAVGLVGALVAPVGGAVWWLAHGTDGPLDRTPKTVLPGYLTELGANGRTGATLVVGGDVSARDDRVSYRVVRGTAPRLGDAGLLQVSEPDATLTRAVAAVFTPNGVDAPAALGARGIAYVYAPAPVSSTVSGAFDAADGFEAASAPRPRTRTWQITAPVSTDAINDRGDVSRPILALLQVLAWIAVVVMAAPSRPQRRTGGAS